MRGDDDDAPRVGVEVVERRVAVSSGSSAARSSASTTVLPVTMMFSGSMFSASRFCLFPSVGARCSVASRVVSARFDLLRERRVRVAGAEARLEVDDRDLPVEGGEAADEGGGRVALHDDRVGALGLEERRQSIERACRHRGERLARRAEIEIVVRDDSEQVEHLREHLAVLPGHDDDRLEVRRPLELRDHGGDLDRLRTGAEDHHHAVAFHPPMPPRVPRPGPCRPCARRSPKAPSRRRTPDRCSVLRP